MPSDSLLYKSEYALKGDALWQIIFYGGDFTETDFNAMSGTASPYGRGGGAMTRSRTIWVLEAAHITPYRGAATNTPSNGLLLRADVHTVFDKSAEFTLRRSSALKSPSQWLSHRVEPSPKADSTQNERASTTQIRFPVGRFCKNGETSRLTLR
jgi:hypothetical protein